MKTHVVVLNYPESGWGTDLVKFIFDYDVSACDLENELEYAKEDISTENFVTLQDYADAVCTAAAEALHGTWSHVVQTCVIDIRYN